MKKIKKRWRDDIKQQIDFTVEKVAELQKLRDSLEDTNNQVMNAHCNTNVTAEPIVPKSNVSNITNTTSPPNNTNINKATNNTTLINTTNNTISIMPLIIQISIMLLIIQILLQL